MSKTLTNIAAAAGLSAMALATSGCAGYGPVQTSVRGNTVMNLARGIELFAEDAINNPCVAATTRGAIINGQARACSQRIEPVDLPNVGREFQLRSRNTARPSARDPQIVVLYPDAPIDASRAMPLRRQCENEGGVVRYADGIGTLCVR